MVAAVATGLILGIGSLLSYGGYNIISSLNRNNTSAANTTQDTMLFSNQSINAMDNLSIPLNIDTKIEESSMLIDTKNTSFENILSMLSQEMTQNQETAHKKETHNESDNIHKGIELDESEILMGREINYENKLFTNEINQNQDIKLEINNQKSTNVNKDIGFKTNDVEYQERELDITESPKRLNPKLTLTIDNKNTIERSDKENQMNTFDFEPFPSMKNQLNDGLSIDHIPENQLYKTFHESEHQVPVKNPLYPITKKNEKQHQENVQQLNEYNSQSYKKINPKLMPNLNTNLNSKEADTINHEFNFNENIESNVNKPEAKSLINEDLAIDTLQPAIIDLVDLVSKTEEILESEIELEEDQVQKTFLGNTELSIGDLDVKTLFTSYAEIAGIVIASVLIVTGLIFLSIRQALKHRRQAKIQKRVADH